MYWRNAIVMLEDFKRRQAEEDKANREARMAKYEKLREQVELLHLWKTNYGLGKRGSLEAVNVDEKT